MEIKFNLVRGNLYIYLIGELYEATAKRAKEELDGIIDGNASAYKVIFEMSGLTFMDSTGVGTLIGRYKKLKGYDIKGYVSNPTASVEKVLEVCGLYRLMPKI